MSGKLEILVVDDDRRMVKTICDILKVMGYEAMEAYSGKEAMEKVMAGNLDCILMDIRMPDIDGIEALEKIKVLFPKLPVVLMSAYATDEQVEEAKRRGAFTVLTKPIDLQVVLSFLALLRKEESVLVVDDDPVFCRTLKDILESRGFHVETETDPGKVLGNLERTYKLTVLLDLKIGNVDGLDVLKEIRKKYPTKPVVLVTGYREGMSASIEQGMEIGAFTALYKPLEIEELVRIIEDISRRKLQSLLGEPFNAPEAGK